jgi:flagellar protein FlbD
MDRIEPVETPTPEQGGPMISLTRFNSDERIAINPDLIERIEEIPDTVVTMTNGNRHVISECIDEITEKIRTFRASLLTLAMTMADHPSVAGTVHLHVVRGARHGDDTESTFDSGAGKP